MSNYSINRGIGRSAEFKGLKAQYLFIFAGGLLAVFVIFVVMYMAGINQWICIGFGLAAASVLVWLTFSLNRKYGEYGLMKLLALKNHPSFIINRIRMSRLFTRNTQNKKV
jgi:type IV secretory pathway TrbD component